IARLRATVEHLAAFDRPSASEGERRAAEWIGGELEAHGVPAVIEEEPAVGSMAVPVGLLSALGALAGLGGRRTALLGLLAAAGGALAFADIATRTVVPGANDNLSAVAVVLELARLLREEPVRGVRVLLVSTGSEESFMEGMRGWVRRHRAELDPARTRVVVL